MGGHLLSGRMSRRRPHGGPFHAPYPIGAHAAAPNSCPPGTRRTPACPAHLLTAARTPHAADAARAAGLLDQRFSPRPATPRRTPRGRRSQPPGRPPGTDSLAQQSPSLSRADLSQNRGDSPSGVPSDPGRRTRCPCAPARQIATGGLRVRKQQDTPLDFIPPGGMGAGCMRPPPLRRGCHNTTLSAPVLGMPAPRHVSP